MSDKRPTRFTIDDITVLCGDSNVLLRTLQPYCTVVTDPPFTMMTSLDATAMLEALNYKASDLLVFTNPLSGYLHRGRFAIVPELSTAATEYHRHQRPLDAVTALVALTDGTVIDPYCGSGTTLLAAHSLHRASIGIEYDRRTFERCCQHLMLSMGYGGLFS